MWEQSRYLNKQRVKTAVIRFENVTVKFKDGTTALSKVNFAIDSGEFVFIVGPSGAGKTTLLRLLLREILPTEGAIFFNDWEINKLRGRQLPQLRRKIGAIFQDYKLLIDRTVFENVAIALEIHGKKRKEIIKEAEEILQLCGLLDKKVSFPLQLSGGELQRTSIARALAGDPEIIFADEPTGNLDPASAWQIVKLLEKINNLGKTVLMGTHNFDVVDSLNKRVITLKKGRIISDKKRGKYENH